MTRAMLICPLVLEHRLMEAILYICARTSLDAPSTSMYPPRRPHSLRR